MSSTSGRDVNGTVGVLLRTYPKVSETFILEEILELERQGLNLKLFALRHPTDIHQNPENAGVLAPVSYLDTTSPAGIARHIALAVRHPIRYTRALRVVFKMADSEPRVTTLHSAVWLANEIRRLGVAHLHSHFISEPSTVAEIASLLADVRYSISAHAKDIYLSSTRGLRRKLGSAAFTVTCTEHNFNYLAEIAPQDADVRCIHHGVRLELFSPAEPKPGVPVILAVGRLRAKKGFDILVEACAKLRDDGVRFECRIIGYGPEEAVLRAQIDKLGLESRITLLGKLTRSGVIAHYQDASIVAQPCRITQDGDRDGIPNVLIEAMAMQIPVVSTTVSGIPELVTNNESGVLVAPDDPDALEAAMVDLLADPERARAIGSRGREVVEEHYAVEHNAIEIGDLLRSACAADSDAVITDVGSDAHIAYVVKGYPRLSEIFIASEIYRMEQLGMALRLFVLKPSSETKHHRLVDRIIATPEYLPPVTSISKRSAWRWTINNGPSYAPIIWRVARKSPVGFGRAVLAAFGQAVRARKGFWPRKLYLKEFFQAAAIADQVVVDPEITHLHSHFCHGATTVTWLAALMSGRTFSFTAHAKDIYDERLNPAGLLKRKLEAAEFAATCTEANRVFLQAKSPQAKVRRVYHGLNAEFEELLESSSRLARVSPRFEILAVGRLVEKKGMDLLIRAAVILHDSGLDFEIRIVGEDGDHGHYLRGLVSELGLGSNVRFVGPLGQAELLAQYRQASVFCLPCRVLADGDRDGIPNVLMEAMATGLAVISTPISGIPELIEDRVNGLLVGAENVESLAKALLELAADDDLRHSLAAAGRRDVISKFDAWNEARTMVELLSGVITRAPSSRGISI